TDCYIISISNMIIILQYMAGVHLSVMGSIPLTPPTLIIVKLKLDISLHSYQILILILTYLLDDSKANYTFKRNESMRVKKREKSQFFSAKEINFVGLVEVLLLKFLSYIYFLFHRTKKTEVTKLSKLSQSKRTKSMVIYEEKSNAPDPPEGGGRRRMSNVSDLERRNKLQRQLVLLLHAYQCRPAINDPCPIPHCQLMRNILGHMNTCQFGTSCQVPNCVSFRLILLHWSICVKVHCQICEPIINFKDCIKCNGV
ncbi:hypothetical protein Anas_02234, partial [Armadillidium nasatum]